MGILDFAKKQEFDRIKQLETDLSNAKRIIDKKSEEIKLLKLDNEKIISKNETEIKLLNSDIGAFISQIFELQEKLKVFEPIENIELQLKSKKDEVNNVITELEVLEKEYNENYSIFQKLKEQVKLYEEDCEAINFGLYEPIFDFNSTDEYREKIRLNYENQKQLIKENKAITSHEDEVYYKSEYKFLGAGYKKSINSYKKLISIAFNSECDALISKVKWNNVSQLNSKITDIFHRINTNSREFCSFILLQNSVVNGLNDAVKDFFKKYSNHMIEITPAFLELKYEELALHHEFEMKNYEEKEEQRRNRELLREEEKARRDFERAKSEADEEEILVKKQLEVAKIQASENSNNDTLKIRILELEEKLKAVQEIRERAISMAQQTRRGYIYVISNIGSFGENIYKIGMTRRLDPFERVRELGNASVPFKFDVHTMIFSEDAPSLENELHKTFSEKRINHYNLRREFFKVTLEEIQNKIHGLNLSAEFISIPEAMEFRETQSILNRLLNQKLNDTNMRTNEEINFPSSLQRTTRL